MRQETCISPGCTRHVLAISGLHIGIVAALFFVLLKILPIPRKAQYAANVILVVGYSFLTGGRPSVVRATIMTVIFLMSFLVEQEQEPINSLSLAALVLLVINPPDLFDVGFQLSFVSVLSIIVFYPKIIRIFAQIPHSEESKTASFVFKSLAVSLSAWLGVAGIIAYYFHIVTPITVLANLVIVPLIGAVIALGIGLFLTGGIAFCAVAFASCIKLALNTMVGVIYLFDQCPGSCFYLKNVSCWHLVIYYFFLAGVFLFPYLLKLTKQRGYARVNDMRKYINIFIFIVVLSMAPSTASAFWMWTPETNEWVNPKYAVKETPQEQLDYAMGFFNKKDYKRAIQEFEKLLKHYPRAREAPEAQFYIGLAYEKQGLLVKAFNSYQVVIEKYPFSERGSEIIKKQYDIGNALLEGRGKGNKFIQAIAGSEYDIIETFRTVIKNAPYGEYAAPSQYKIGLYLQEKQLYMEARDEFEKTINDYPDTEWAKAARYQIALVDAKRSTHAQYDQAVTGTAIEEFKDFVESYPEADLSEKAKKHIHQLRDKEAENNFMIAQFYEKQKNYAAARIYYDIVVKDYKQSSWAKKALEKIRELNTKIDKGK